MTATLKGLSVRPYVIDQQDACVLRLHGLALQLILLKPYPPRWNTLANKRAMERKAADAQSGITLGGTLCVDHRLRHELLQCRCMCRHQLMTALSWNVTQSLGNQAPVLFLAHILLILLIGKNSGCLSGVKVFRQKSRHNSMH